jgi:vacuolar-type H+-ATPase subunit H
MINVKKIDALEAEAKKLYQKMIKDAEQRKDKLFEELDEATNEMTLTYKNSYNNINQMIDRSKFP